MIKVTLQNKVSTAVCNSAGHDSCSYLKLDMIPTQQLGIPLPSHALQRIVLRCIIYKVEYLRECLISQVTLHTSHSFIPRISRTVYRRFPFPSFSMRTIIVLLWYVIAQQRRAYDQLIAAHSRLGDSFQCRCFW